MIELFNINNHIIDTSEFSNLLHDDIVVEFEKKIADYVGAKYACSVNSATNAIYLSLLNKDVTVNLPSIIPPVVANAILTSGNYIEFIAILLYTYITCSNYIVISITFLTILQ